MQILNIDAFMEPKRQLTYRGVSYPVNEIAVQDFIDNLKAVEQLEEARKSGSAKVSEYMALTVDTIAKAIPSFPREELDKLSVEAVSKISEFVRGELDKAAASETPNAEGDSAKKD